MRKPSPARLKLPVALPDEVYVERVLVPDAAVNGGFFDPPAGEPVRVVSTRHSACGKRTRVLLPAAVPARVVRRVRCGSCAQPYDAYRVEEIAAPAAEAVPAVEAAAAAPPADSKPRRAISLPSPSISLPSPSLPRPRLPKLNPGGRFWRLASVPLAAAAVLAGLLLLQGEEPAPSSSSPAETTTPAAGTAAEDAAERASGASGDAEGTGASKSSEIVSSSEFSLALPAGWERVDPPAGATFAALGPDGAADATLWIDENPKLDFPTFIAQSMAQLEALAGAEPRVIERVPGPTPETTIVRLAADSPPGQPTYEVTLRAAGPYRYYLATTIEPDAPQEAIAGAELITGSFAPQAGVSQ